MHCDASTFVSAQYFLSKLWICDMLLNSVDNTRAFDQVEGFGCISKIEVEGGNIFCGVVEE